MPWHTCTKHPGHHTCLDIIVSNRFRLYPPFFPFLENGGDYGRGEKAQRSEFHATAKQKEKGMRYRAWGEWGRDEDSRERKTFQLACPSA